MAHVGENWDDDPFPSAYQITIRTYGTWLHGDDKTSVDTHHGYNKFGGARRPASGQMRARMLSNMKGEAVVLNEPQRIAVNDAMGEVCQHRGYYLRAVNTRSNHSHIVVSAQEKPEFMANSFKSYSTRELRRRHLIGPETTVWARGRRRRYLWKANHVIAVVDYVLYSQGLIEFEKWYESNEEKYT
jgi:REP element-mobilizing transposase RayT